MKLTRREFLKIAAETSVALPWWLSQGGCAPTLTAADRETGLSLGYVVGDVTHESAIVWLRAEPGSRVSLHYGKDPALSQFKASDGVMVEADSDYTAHLSIAPLESATTYYYRAAVAGKKPGPIARFLTAPKADDNTEVKFCFSGDTREGYQPFTIMDAIRANRPNFFIHLGDTIYADRGGWIATELAEYRAKYVVNRSDAASLRLFSDTSVYVLWDDHEIANNYEGFHPLAAIGRRAFFDYWPVQRNPKEPDRLYRSSRWGRAIELFFVDARQYRDRARGTLLGKRQKQWLFESLAASTALVKCIATSVPFYGGGADRWDGYPRERTQLLQWIEQKKIKGVVFIAADVHYAAVTRVPGDLALSEIVTGPMAAQLNIAATGLSKRFEFFFNQNFNFGMMTIDPNSSPPHMLVEIRDPLNETLYKKRIAVV
jgi:alkaline phosphatase D